MRAGLEEVRANGRLLRFRAFAGISLLGCVRGRYRLGHRKNARIGNLPAKRFRFALLVRMFFKKNGFAGVGGHFACRRQQNVAGAIFDLDTPAN